MNFIKEYSGVVALIVLAIMSLSGLVGHKGLVGTTSCGSITCLEGGLRLVADVGGDFESDVAAVFNSTVNITGAVTAGAISASSLVVSGLTTLTGTTTVGQSIVMTETTGCIQFNATSTATVGHIVLNTGSTTAVATAGLIGFAFGACN